MPNKSKSKFKRAARKQRRQERATKKRTMGAQQIPEPFQPFQNTEPSKFSPRITTESPSFKAALEEDQKRRSQGMDSVVVHEKGKWRARTPTPPQDSSGTKGKRKKRGTRKRKRRRTKSSKKRKTRR